MGRRSEARRYCPAWSYAASAAAWGLPPGSHARSELPELVINVEAERLKRPRRGMNIAGAAMHHPGDDVGERAGGRDGSLAAGGDDGAGNSAGAWGRASRPPPPMR